MSRDDVEEFKRELDEEAARIRSGFGLQVTDGRLAVKLGSESPIRADILDEAKQAVCSDRNADYGEPIDNFTRWAGVCNALGYRGPGGRKLKPHDMAIMSTGGKLSRAMQTPGKRDHSVDISGYGSLIFELVNLEDR